MIAPPAPGQPSPRALRGRGNLPVNGHDAAGPHQGPAASAYPAPQYAAPAAQRRAATSSSSPSTARATASGCSIWATCPQSSITNNRASGKAANARLLVIEDCGHVAQMAV